MDILRVRLSPIEEMQMNEIKYESYIRSLTDDFSVIDRVSKYSKTEEDY